MNGLPPDARVLLVEDDAMSRDFAARLLESEGLTVETVADGPGCLARLERDPLPDLVLLDVSMPGMSGLEVLAWIRARFASEQLPVVMVSALADASDVVAALEAGADDYVTKPVNPTLLMARVAAGLRRRAGVAELISAEQAARLLEALDAVVRSIDPGVTSLERTIAELRADGREPDRAAAMAADVARVRGVLERVRGLAALRGRTVHAGLSGLIDATLERLAGGEPAAPEPDRT